MYSLKVFKVALVFLHLARTTLWHDLVQHVILHDVSVKTVVTLLAAC